MVVLVPVVLVVIICLPVTAPGAHDDGGGAPGGVVAHLLAFDRSWCP